MVSYSFAGHDTFHCRNYWIKKGLDHIWNGNRFNDDAIIGLGVGKNMVSSIRFWLRAFGVVDPNDHPTSLSELIFKDNGCDPFVEDIGTIWLLHYMLVTTEQASIYSLVFNEFKKQRMEFNREQLLTFLERKCRSNDVHFHVNSLKKDIGVLLNNYTTPEKSKGIEDDFSGLLYELNLVQRLEKYGQLHWYKIENKQRAELPAEIVLYCILAQKADSDNSITFNQLLNERNSVGSVFALSANGLMAKIEQLLMQYKKYLVFTDDGGVRLLQFKKHLDSIQVLKNYYGA